MSFLARLIAMLSRALGAARNGLSNACGWLHDAASEAVEPVTSRLPAVRDAALAGAGYGAIAAGAALRAPGAILGSVLGRILPSPAPTAGAVADEAVARDNRKAAGAAAPALDMNVSMFHSAAEDLRLGGPAAMKKYAPYVPEFAADWLKGLSRRDLDVALRLDPATLYRHAMAEREADTTPLLPPPAHLRPDYVQTLIYSAAELAAMQAQAKRNLAGSAREAASMATRGSRPRPEPVWDDVPDYAAPAPAMH